MISCTPSDLPDGDRKHGALVFDACAHIARIDVHKNELLLRLRSRTPPKGLPTVEDLGGEPKELNDHPDEKMLQIAWRKPPGKRFREILLPSSESRQLVRPIRAERRVSLIAAIAKGRRWLNQIVTGTVLSAEDIAIREKCSVRQVNLTISLAFLAPGLVKAAVEGRLPRGVGVERLRDPAPEWRRQFESLGLAVG